MKTRKLFTSVRSIICLLFLSLSLLGFTVLWNNSDQWVSGYTPAMTQVGENGESRIQVPISVPQGTILSPQLSIAYSSQGGNGILGQGFSLNGLYSITRIPATVAQDGFVDGIDFDDKDRFALNGERLMAIDGVYGADGTEYRTEQNNFSKIISYGNAGTGPAKFKVWLKDGLIMEFGYTEDSGIEASGKVEKLLWLVNRVTDRKGNFMTFHYAENSTNSEYRPVQILYTGNTTTGLAPYNSIHFIYENRSDTIATFLEDSKIKLTKRLKRIEAFDHQQLMRSYDLEYLPQTEYEASKLIKIKECGRDGTCFQPTIFDWATPQADLDYEKNESGLWYGHHGGPGNNALGDFNGDGMTDMMGHAGGTNWHVCLSNGNSFDNSYWTSHAGGPGNNFLGDFNGDGMTDMAAHLGGYNWQICFSDGSDFNCETWIGHAGSPGNNIIGDFNGDGLSDMAAHAGGRNWHLALSNGSGFDCAFKEIHPNGVANNITADFNGDGQDDFATAIGASTWEVCLADSSDFTCTFWMGHPGGVTQNYPGDYNGDGKVDLAGYTTKGQWQICLSNGAGFECSLWEGHNNGSAFNWIGDFNGDAKSDLLTYRDAGGLWETNISDGVNFYKKINFGHGGGLNNNNALGDFNGDGKTDIAGYAGGGNWHVALSDDEEGTWTEGAYGNWENASDRVRSLDVNADGLPDMVIGPDNLGKWYVMKNTGEDFVDEGAWISGAYGNWDGSASRIRPMDVNADGLPDMVIGPDGDGRWYVLKNTGDSFVDEGAWISDAYGNWDGSADRIRPMDVNADGLPDMVIGPDNLGKWYVMKNTGDSFVDEGAWISDAYGNWDGSANRIRPMDVNTDGLPDMVIGPDNLGKWYVLKNTGDAFVDEGAWISNAYGHLENSPDRIRAADVNGDGRQDLLLGPDGGKWYVLKNTGTRFVDEGAWIQSPYNWATNKTYYLDCTGDGLVDVLYGPQSNGQWFLLRNNGTEFINEGQWIYGYWHWHGAIGRMRPMDVNGDGLPEMVFGPDNQGQWFVHKISEAQQASVISSVTNGNGLTTDFKYRPLTDPEVYTKGDTATFPRVDFTSSLYVVSEVHSDNGLGEKNIIQHEYADAKFNVQGRGFRGFGKTIKTDLTRGVQSTIFYERDYKCISSKVKRVETRLLDGTLLNETDHSIAVQALNEHINFSYVNETVEKEYELNGTLVKTKTTQYTYDDFGNVTQLIENHGDGFYIINTQNNYDNDSGAWILGRLTQSTVTKQLEGKAPITKSSSFAYDADGLLIQEIFLPNHATLKLQKDYTLDDFGNIIVETQSGPNITTRSDYTTYDTEGRLVLIFKNAAQHRIEYEYLDGWLQTTTDPNGLSTIISRDGFGRSIRTDFADGTWELTAYQDCDNNCPEYATSYVEKSASGTGISRVYFDALDRKIREATAGFNGQDIYLDYRYNHDGTTLAISQPYLASDPSYWTQYEYDAVKRVHKETLPGNRINCIEYEGLMTKATNAEGQESTRIENQLGKLITVTDPYDNSVHYDYDSDLNQTKIIYPGDHSIQITYDLRSFKTSMSDPDMGFYQYEHNALGLLNRQINPAGQEMSLEYDILNRPIRRTEEEGITEWRYDPQYGIGKVSQLLSDGQVVESHFYDNFGRLGQKVYQRGELFKMIGYTYDEMSRLATEVYPNGFVARYGYNERGYLTTVKNDATDETLWQADAYNAFNTPTAFTLGNGLQTNRTFDATTGLLTKIQTGTSQASSSIQDLEFSYSPLGNLTARKDLFLELSETMEYDALNRLIQAQVNGQEALTVAYDALGNITNKSDIGQYFYGENGAGPHVLTSIDHSDAACAYAFHQNITYTSFNYAAKIANTNKEIQLSYGPNRERTRMQVIKNGQILSEKNYFGGIYEEASDQNGVSTSVCYVRANNEVIAFVTQQEAEPSKVTYLHKDHLGSVSVQTKENGSIKERYSYDPWGKRRDAYTWASIQVPPALALYDRGFTFHEMLDMDWLVLMNARVYNPLLGRFLSPDPFVQFPEDLQSLNRFAYVLNNPLSFTDPSGFFLKKIGRFLKKNLGTIVGIAIAVATGGAGGFFATSLGTFWGTVASGAAAGFGASFTSTVVSGGGLGDALSAGLKGAVFGGITAGITYGIGSLFGGEGLLNPEAFGGFKALHPFAKLVTHSLVQGGISEVRGGEFRHGLISTFASGFGGDSLIARMIIGGTASELSGGKFANGAFTAAFVLLFNDRMHTNGPDERGRGEHALSIGNKIASIFDFKNSIIANAVEETKGFFSGLSKVFKGLQVAEGFQQYTRGDYGNLIVTTAGVGAGIICGATLVCGGAVLAGGFAAEYFGAGNALNNYIFNSGSNSLQWDQNGYAGNHSG